MFTEGKTINAIEVKVRKTIDSWEDKPLSVAKALGTDLIDFPLKRYDRR